MKLDDLISEMEVNEKFKHLFAAGELREARQRGEIEFYALRKGVHYTEEQLIEYINKRVRRPCQNAPLRAVPENDKPLGSSSSATNGSGERPCPQTISDIGTTATDKLVERAFGTADIEQAKEALIRAVLGDAPEDPEAADVVYFGAVARYYLDNHAVNIRSQAAAKRAFELAQTFLKASTGKAAPMVADFSLARQESFWRWCRDEHELSAKSIATYMSTVRAAMVYSARPRIIVDSKGQEREGRVLSTPYYIEASEKRVVQVTGLPPSAPRDFVPTDVQLAAFLDAIFDETNEKEVREREHIFRFCIMALNTWARPEAVTELNVAKQVDFAAGLIYLNPPGRIQNRKFRPTIRLTDNLRNWLVHWNLERPIVYNGQPVDEVLAKTIKKIAIRAGVPQMVRYSLRHYMNTRAMRVPADIRPDREERAIQMGHHDPRFKQTSQYEHMDPDYLTRAAKATDAIMLTLDKLSTKSLFAPGTAAKGLYVVERKAEG